MTESIEIPSEIPAMTLPGVVFFPKAMMPLHIFEPRYRQMLADALDGHRMFALLGLDEKAAEDEDAVEPPFMMASAGMIRICKMNPDGTSNLLLQGVSRIRVLEVVREEPYRIVKVEELTSSEDVVEPGTRAELAQLLDENRNLGGEATEEMLASLNPLDDDEAYVDLVAFVLCKETLRKQRLLETLELSKRASLLASHLRNENERLRFLKEAMEDFSDEDLEAN